MLGSKWVGSWLAFASVFCFVAGCSDSQSDAEEPDLQPEGEGDAEREAEEEAERQAEAAEQARRNTFCGGWTELYCRSLLECHPGASFELLADCMDRYASYCDVRMEFERWRDDAATQCFDTAKDWDCSTPLEQFFSENCNDVFIFEGSPVGELCTFAGSIDCVDGASCRLDPPREGYVLDCNGSCAVVRQLGEDCAEDPCDEGLRCAAEEDERGFPISVCREATATDPEPSEDPNGCAPHEQFVASENRCIARSLPGEPCGGSFDINCLGTTCEDGMCEWGITELNASCSLTDCQYPYQCVRTFTDQLRCEVHDRSCSAHPMMLLN